MDGVQIFLSYARDDDDVPLDGPPTKSFVTHIRNHLIAEFKSKGPSRPRIWQDQQEVGRAQQFGPRIEGAIADSAILLVVLSSNWLASEYCQWELDSFVKRWERNGENLDIIRQRIVVVSKRRVAVSERPIPLQGQQSYEFFYIDRVAGLDEEHEFFKNGEVRDRRWVDRIEELATFLWRQAERLAQSKAASVPQIEATIRYTPKKSRTIFLAKPCSDMIEAYDRLTRELEGRGYEVAPAGDDEIPDDSSAQRFVDDALKMADMSIHLLGEKSGRAPEDLPPISKLQLERAAKRVSEDASGNFHRVIWAPKSISPVWTADTIVRDPLAVLAKFDLQLPTDKIIGEDLSRFVDFVGQHLLRWARPEDKPPEIPAESSIYVYHSKDDEEYAILLKKALEERAVEVHLPAALGPDNELRSFHAQKLKQCDAVALCWAHASETWVLSQTDELKNWRALGRKAPFAFRGVVAGPPPHRRKRNMEDVFPKGSFDLVVDLEDKDKPLPELLDRLIPHSARV